MRGNSGVPEGSLEISGEHRSSPTNMLSRNVEELLKGGSNLEIGNFSSDLPSVVFQRCYPEK